MTITEPVAPPPNAIGPKERLTILLAEYNTLRAEVLAARAAVAQAIGIGAPLALGLMGLAFSAPDEWPKCPFFVFAALIIVSAVAIAYWNNGNTRAFTARIRALEEDINRRAEERLLLWETDHGWGSIFWRTNKHHKGPPIEN
jgi:hypothetical protein